MTALDIFCGAGGVAQGLAEAGFCVTGIDIERACSDYYPGTFVLADAMQLPVRPDDFDFIWASPPCQRFSRGKPARMKADYPDLIAPIRNLLADHPLTCIENVVGAPIRADLVLTGPMVGLHRIIRRRHFELSFDLKFALQQRPILGGTQADWKSGKLRSINTSGATPYFMRHTYGIEHRTGVREAREIMGLDADMPMRMVGECIPPAYARLIGRAAASLLA